MAVYHSQQIDILRDLLTDTPDTQISFAMKRMYLNMGMAAMWPRVFRVVSDDTTELAVDTYEYDVPSGLRGGRIFQVEKSLSESDDHFYPLNLDDYQMQKGASGADFIILNFNPRGAWDGGLLRFSAAVPLTPYAASSYAASQTEAYTGPDYTMEGPVLYAMSRISSIPLDTRVDYSRFSVQSENRAATPNELLALSSFWLDEFERRMAEWNMALPASRY